MKDSQRHEVIAAIKEAIAENTDGLADAIAQVVNRAQPQPEPIANPFSQFGEGTAVEGEHNRTDEDPPL